MKKLLHRLHTRNFAVTGTHASFEALQRKQAETLVMIEAYVPEAGWACTACGAVMISQTLPLTCSICAHAEMTPLNLKEEMVRLAEKEKCKIEVVQNSEALVEQGGVGCLLRYPEPEAHVLHAETQVFAQHSGNE